MTSRIELASKHFAVNERFCATDDLASRILPSEFGHDTRNSALSRHAGRQHEWLEGPDRQRNRNVSRAIANTPRCLRRVLPQLRSQMMQELAAAFETKFLNPMPADTPTRTSVIRSISVEAVAEGAARHTVPVRRIIQRSTTQLRPDMGRGIAVPRR
jgi:hypothetical protein